jgi:hypothetical protein
MATAADRGRATAGRPAVLPSLASRSLWLAAAWTGLAAAFVGAVVAIVAVAICWLPASGTGGKASSAIHAGLLTFLAGLHGGITIDGTHATFVPLGLTLAIATLAWRAGSALGDAADEAAEETGTVDRGRLVGIGAVQLATFALTCGITSAFAPLGTSSTKPTTTAFAAMVLWLLTGSLAYARSTALWTDIERRRPGWLVPAVRLGMAGIAVYVAAGALLTAGSLALHWSAVSTLSRLVGGGWSGVPILLLGILTAPNAAVAGAGYLSGAGFAVGGHTVVRLWSTAHGALPAFPLLGAVPNSPANPMTWLMAVATPVTAGACIAVLARRAPSPREQWRNVGAGIAATAVFAALAAAVAGGGIGNAGLAAIGVSSWQFAVAAAGGSGVAAAAVLGALTGWAALHQRGDVLESVLVGKLSAIPGVRTERPDPAANKKDTDTVDAVDPNEVTARLPRVRAEQPERGEHGELAG